MTKNQKRSIVLIIVIFTVFSAVAFALPFQKNDLFWVAYVFGVIAIAAQFYVLRSAFYKAQNIRSRFYGFPIAKVGAIYMTVQLVLSIIFMALAAIAPVWIAILLFVIVFAAGIIGFIGVDSMRDEIERQDAKLMADTSCMTTLRSLVYPLAGRCKSEEAKKAVSALADEFRYSDPVSSEATGTIEAELENAVAGLQAAVSDGDETRIMDVSKGVSELLAERNRICKLSK